MDHLEGAISVPLHKGDALLFVDGLMHGGSSRTSTEGERRVTIYRYGPLWGATRFGYEYSPALLGRLTPERRKLLQPVSTVAPSYVKHPEGAGIMEPCPLRAPSKSWAVILGSPA